MNPKGGEEVKRERWERSTSVAGKKRKKHKQKAVEGEMPLSLNGLSKYGASVKKQGGARRKW